VLGSLADTSSIDLPPGTGCATLHPTGLKHNRIIIGFYSYTIVLDAFILVFTVTGLSKRMSAQSTPLWLTLYKQGIGYLVATLALNLPMLVLIILNLNEVMNIFFATPGAMVSVMVSSQAVVSLMKIKVDRNATSPNDSSEGDSPVEVKTHTELRGGILTTHLTMPRSIPATATEQSGAPPLPSSDSLRSLGV